MECTSSSPFSYKQWKENKTFAQTTLLFQHKSTLKPSFYNKEKVVRTAGNYFAGLSAVSFAGTTYAALFFTALPNVVIGVTLGLGTVTVTGVALTALCLYKKTFWNDPEFRAKKGIEAATDITESLLSAKQVMEKYGTVIRDYQILSNEDLSTLLHHETKNYICYTHFIANNGKENLKLFCGDEKENLKELFSNYCRNLKCSIDEIRKNYKEEINFFEINDEHLRTFVILEQVKDVLNDKENYFTFRNNQPNIDSLPKLLYSFQLTTLKNKFLSELKTLKTAGVVKILEDYKSDCEIFGISKEEVEKIILPKEFKQIKSYADFKRRNGEDSTRNLILIQPNFQIAMGQLFLKSSFPYMVSEESMKDYACLGLNLEIIELNVHRDVRELSYDQFVEKHTDEIFSVWSFDKVTTCIFKEKLLDVFINGNNSLYGIYNTFSKQIQVLGILSIEYRIPVLQKEIVRAKDYLEFEIRNGKGACESLCRDQFPHDELIAKFLKMPFKKMIEADYQKIGNDIGITDDQMWTIFLETVKTCKIQEIPSFVDYAKKWDMTLDKCYDIRWKNMKMIDIITKDSVVFEQKIKTSFGPQIWRDKASEETCNLTIKEILKNYKRCLELGILQNTLLSTKVENEIANVNSFEELVKTYGASIFEFKLISKDSQKLTSLINQYFRFHYQEIMEGVSLPEIMVKYDLISTNKTVILMNHKTEYMNVFSSYATNLQNICLEADSSKKIKEDELARLNRGLDEDRLKLKLIENQMNESQKVWSKTLSDVERIPKEIADLEEELKNYHNKITTNSEEKLSDVENSLKDIESKINDLETQKLNPKKVTGFFAALTDNQKGELEAQIKLRQVDKKELLEKKADLEKAIKLQDPVHLTNSIKNLEAQLKTKKENINEQEREMNERIKSFNLASSNFNAAEKINIEKCKNIQIELNHIELRTTQHKNLALGFHQQQKTLLENNFIQTFR